MKLVKGYTVILFLLILFMLKFHNKNVMFI